MTSLSSRDTRPSQRPGETPLVHGLAGDLVAPDWPPLTDAEADWVAERWGLSPSGDDAPVTDVLWRSPRPLSAAGLVRVPGRGTVFVKRHDHRVRDAGSLVAEHRFAAHLRGAGLQAPEVLGTPDGLTAVVRQGPPGSPSAVYEVHAVAPGGDLYRDAESWTPFRSLDHAREAGALLARLHLAAAGFDGEARPFGPLVDSDEIVAAAEPLAALAGLVRGRAHLYAGLEPHAWVRETEGVLGPLLAEASRHARGLPRLWTHGDWHPSNLTWSTEGTPRAVLDLGLANRTTAVRDVAIALERSCVSWLDPVPVADLDAVRALLDGYGGVRPLSETEWAALPALTATAHVEFALSEVEYYAGVLGSPDRAAIAYRDYLLGHARWFSTGPGRSLLQALSPPRTAA